MCGIAGIIYDETSAELGSSLQAMLETMQHRGPDGAGFAVGTEVQRKEHLTDLRLSEKKGRIGLGHIRLAITGGITGMQPFQSDNKKLVLLHNGEIYNYRELRKSLQENVRFATDTDSEVILKLVEQHYSGNLHEAVKKVLPMLDGVYALAITDNKQTIIARDKIGVRQLYYCRCNSFTAFASEKKPLIALTNNEARIHRLLPAHVAVLDGNDINEIPFWEPDILKEGHRVSGREEALQLYDKAIRRAVAKRVAGRDRVGVIFSGGIDSMLIAYLVKEAGVPFTCYTAGRAEAEDVQWAEMLAEAFEFPLQVKRLSLEEIEEMIPQMIFDIEDYSLNQVEVAVPIYASVRMAQEQGERVLLTGQGADELFGGYPWYPKIVAREGYQSFESYSWEDAFLLYKECLEREDKIAMAHSIELRVPFLDPEVIQVAFRIAPELKIHSGDDSLIKRIHREYCQMLCIPQNIAFRKKEAAQHGADVHSAFEQLAQKNNISKALLTLAGYDQQKTVTETLGSSSRYGYRYGDRHLWKPLPEVQFYLDSIASKMSIMPREIKQYVAQTSERIQELKKHRERKTSCV